jgi:cation:H+ antiporter
MSTAKAAIIFAVSALATLVAGVVLERAGDAASSQIGLSGVLFGATVLALATSLPEISTGLQTVKRGDDNLAISDTFGGNAFLPVLFLAATVISGKAVLPQANASDIYLTAIAVLLTVVYAVGLIFRPQRRVIGLGIDSFAVVLLHLAGVGGLIGDHDRLTAAGPTPTGRIARHRYRSLRRSSTRCRRDHRARFPLPSSRSSTGAELDALR